MIEVKGLNKCFGEKTLFKDFHLQIGKGEFVIITGESGSGKTTLLNMIGALEQPDQGEILVEGINIVLKKNRLKYFRDTVGFLFQNFVLLEEKTVLYNLKLMKRNRVDEGLIDDTLSKVGLTDKKNSVVFTLSGGEQQRVALARLMLKECKLILADEPTGSLDEKNSHRVMDILKEMNRNGVTIIFVTHNHNLIEEGMRHIVL